MRFRDEIDPLSSGAMFVLRLIEQFLVSVLALSITFTGVAYGSPGTTLCDPATGKGSWKIVEWIEYSSTGRYVMDWYGNPVWLRSEVTEGPIKTRLAAKMFYDKYTFPGEIPIGAVPWASEPVPTGTSAISPLPPRAGEGKCTYSNAPYPNVLLANTDCVVLMQTKTISEYLCACDTTSPEKCDGIDNNCNGQVDEGLSTDADADGHYTPSSCQTPQDDCVDNDPTMYPGANELCDGKDNNCNGEVDENMFKDADQDGSVVPVGGCPVPGTYDCNDNDPKMFPGNTESCDQKDNNCNGAIDEGCSECGLTISW